MADLSASDPEDIALQGLASLDWMVRQGFEQGQRPVLPLHALVSTPPAWHDTYGRYHT